MKTARIAIVGAGLSGLYAAYVLEQKGVRDYVLLEARDALGGRIASASASGRPVFETTATVDRVDCFDLGPTWFWPGYQRQLDRLIRDLGLERFEQFEAGDMMVERSPHGPPTRMRGYVSSPASMRLVGGMGALIDALSHELDTTRIITGQTVRRLRSREQYVELDSEDAAGRATTWRVEHVLLALPPRLVQDGMEFSPALPPALALQWHATATWMAPHAKYVAIYDTPFWREQGLSGEARSARGPLGEIHDASMPGGSAALFGFFGVPARVRKGVAENVLRTHCRAQFARLFGLQAATPKAEIIKDWALDPYTATTADLDGAAHHTEAPAATAAYGPWRGRLTGIASEWSPQFPGYVAGAIEAASLGVHAYIDTHREDAAAKLKHMGGAQAIVNTIGHPGTVSALIGGLAPQGRLVMLGTGKDPLPVSAGHLVVGERGVLGSITGSPYENEKTLDFSVLAGVRPMIEVMPQEKANEAYQKMKSGNVKFRMVLTMGRQHCV